MTRGFRSAVAAAGVVALLTGCGGSGSTAPPVPAPPAVGAAPPSALAPSGTPSSAPAASGTPSSAPTTARAAAPTRAPAALPASRPLRISIARIGVATRVVDLGRDDDGALETPTEPAQAGWYTGSPEPGTVGPSVILGHVTWNGAAAAFYRLGQLRSGDRVRVTRADGRTATFAVTSTQEYAKDAFPTAEVYANTDRPSLRLITCAGKYEKDRHYYTHNLVVYADLV